MTTMVLAVLAAVVAAAAYGLSGALQHKADWEGQHGASIGPRFFLEVARQPLWLFSLIAMGVAVGGQALALAGAPLVLVQPLLVSGAVFGAVFAALLERNAPDGLVVLGALGVLGGLSLFLVVARPGEPQRSTLPSLGAVWPLAIVFGGLIAGCLVLAARPPTPQTRTLAFALSAGVLYGVNAGMAKMALGQWSTGGLGALVTSWPLWVVVVAGPVGFFLNQQAFSVGVAASPAIAIITVADPLVALGIGVVWLGETVQTGTWRLVGEVAGLVLVVASVALLARRAPQVAGAPDEAGEGSS